MAQSDFTLEDIRTILLEDVRTVFLKDVRAIVDSSIDARFKVFEQKYDADMMAIQQDFLGVYARFDRLEDRMDRVDSRLNGVEGELRSVHRLIGQHSKDIMELRARTT